MSGRPFDDVALSVVAPAHDEAPNLERLLREVHAALDPLGVAWELIIADDGSDDDTPTVLRRLAAGDPRLRSVRLPRRSGQTAALQAEVAGGTGPVDRHPGRRPAVSALRVPGPPRDPGRRRSRLRYPRQTAGPVAPRGSHIRVLELRPPLPARTTPARPRVSAACVPGRRVGGGRSRDAPVRWRTPLVAGALPSRGLPGGAARRSTPGPCAGTSNYTAIGRAGPVARELIHVLGLAWPRSRALRVGLTLAALGTIASLYLYRLGDWPLLEPDEGRNAEVAREMLERGSWSVPYFNGLPYLDKPVLLFWGIAAAFHTIGVGEFAAGFRPRWQRSRASR